MVSFITIEFVVCQVESFQSFAYWFGIHEMALFGYLLPQVRVDFAEIFTRDSNLAEKTAFEQTLKNFKFYGN